METPMPDVPGFLEDLTRLAPRAAVRQDLDGGAFVLRSPEPLQPYGRCVGEWLERWARETPEAPAFAEPAAGGGWTVLSWGALRQRIGAVAQGLFRNPLADPYLLGAASGASLGVVLVLVAGSAAGATLGLTGGGWASHLGIAGAAFGGALAGVGLTLLLAGGAAHSMRLLLAGVVVGVLLGAVSDLLITLAPQARA
jgi:iron complex transport system permease protein